MNISHNKTKAAAVLMIMLQNVIYGIGDPMSKTAYDVMPVYSLLSFRYLIALAFIMLIGWRRVINGLRDTSPRVWLMPSFFIAMAYLFGNVAILYTSPTSVAFLRSLSTTLTPLLLIFWGTRFSIRQIPVQVTVVAGLYLLCAHGGISGFGIGEILALLTAVFHALALITGQKAMSGGEESIDPFTLTAVQTAASAILTSGCAAFTGGWHTGLVTPGIFGTIAYLGIACTVFGYILQNKALGHISSKSVALTQSFCPVMTAVCAFFMLNERMAIPGIIGSLLILAGLIAEPLIEGTGDEKDIKDVNKERSNINEQFN